MLAVVGEILAATDQQCLGDMVSCGGGVVGQEMEVMEFGLFCSPFGLGIDLDKGEQSRWVVPARRGTSSELYTD
jgi:hypothetical protein